MPSPNYRGKLTKKSRRPKGQKRPPLKGVPYVGLPPGGPTAAELFPQAPPPQPPDWQQVAATNTATRNVGLSGAYTTWNQSNLDQEYGFGAGGAANPYSRAALLSEHFQRSQRGTTNSYAGQGQLYSGAYGRQQNENQREYDIGYDQARREYDRLTGEGQFGHAQALADNALGVDQATFEAVLRALGGLK